MQCIVKSLHKDVNAAEQKKHISQRSASPTSAESWIAACVVSTVYILPAIN